MPRHDSDKTAISSLAYLRIVINTIDLVSGGFKFVKISCLYRLNHGGFTEKLGDY
jgi:hypothetical protein